jgi:hypothetical protein
LQEVKKVARFEAVIKRGKGRELWFYHSPLLRLLRKTTSQLRAKYRVRPKKPDWYVRLSGLYRVFGIQNVPEKEFCRLQKTFEEYIGRVLKVKRHKHRFVFIKKDSTWIWLKCVGCDAIDQILYNNFEGVARKIILPYWLSLEQNRPLYRNGWERRRIQQFLAEYKERAIQSVAADIDQQILKLRKKLERARAEKKKSTLREHIQRLQKERKTYEMTNLIL